MDYKDAILKGFVRAVSRIIRQKAEYSIPPQEIETWVRQGSRNRPIQFGDNVLLRSGDMIAGYFYGKRIIIGIPGIVWKYWPKSMLGTRL